jgi:hypothetical protein
MYRQAQAEKKAGRPRRPTTRGTAPSTDQRPRLGRPISSYTALALEVHRAIEVGDHADRLPPLPPYVPRAHDDRLAQVVAAAVGGVSRMAVLVGGSSTGKTRACWEAIQDLSDQWWLWHPIDPSRPQAAAQALAEVGPYTVVWLNLVFRAYAAAAAQARA